MEGRIDMMYLDDLSKWIREEQKGIISPKAYWIDDLSRREGATKFIEHVKAFIDLEGGKAIELNESYTQIRLYPSKDRWYQKVA